MLPCGVKMQSVHPCGFPAFSVLLHSSAKTPSVCSLLLYDCSCTVRIKDRKPIRPHSSYCYTYPPMYVKQDVPMYSMHIVTHWEEKRIGQNGFHSLPILSVREAVSSPDHSHTPEQYSHHRTAKQLPDREWLYPVVITSSHPAPTRY